MLEVTRFVNSRFNSNTYIISHPEYDNVWVVDPGDTDGVFEWMKNHHKSIITGILLTHAHFDHIYGMNNILSQFPISVVYVANEYGIETLSDPKKNGSKYTEEGPIVIMEGAVKRLFRNTVKLWDDTELQVLYTPGHSDDSVCFSVGSILFTGDTLIKDIKTVTKLKTGSVDKLLETQAMLKGLQGHDYIVYPGHGEMFELDGYDLDLMQNGRIA